MSSPAQSDTSDPANWLPAIISEAEKLATYCKMLASKIGSSLLKDEAGHDEGTSKAKELDKTKVIDCCRRLRKAVFTTRTNMKNLENRMVTKFEQKYGNAKDIDVEQLSEASSSKSNKRLVVKIKNYREANSDQGFYAELRDSPSPTLANRAPKRASGSISSLAAAPQSSSLTETEQSVTSDSLPVNEKSQLAIINESANLDDSDVFYDTCSELIDERVVDNVPKSDRFDLTETQNDENLVDSNLSSQDTIKAEDFLNDENTANNEIPESKNMKSALSSEMASAGTSNKVSTTAAKTRVKETSSSPVFVDASSKTCSRLDSASNAKTTSSSSIDFNEKARRELMCDSDSDDSLPDIQLSPRVKLTKKRDRPTLPDLDDPKLKAECAVIVNRINDLVRKQFHDFIKF